MKAYSNQLAILTYIEYTRKALWLPWIMMSCVESMGLIIINKNLQDNIKVINLLSGLYRYKIKLKVIKLISGLYRYKLNLILLI